MGIQDDIFDVEDDIKKLTGKSTQEQFDRIITYLGQVEKENEELRRFFNAAADLKVAMDILVRSERKRNG